GSPDRANDVVELADAPEAALEDSPMSREAEQWRVDGALEGLVERVEIDVEQLHQHVPIFALLKAVEARLGIQMARDARLEPADEARGQKEIVRDHIGRKVSQVAVCERLLLGAAGRFE